MVVFQVLKQRCHKSLWVLYCSSGTVAMEFHEADIFKRKIHYGILAAVRVHQEKFFDLNISKAL